MAGLSEEGKAQRRALAVAKLAKVLGKGTGRGIAATSLMGGSEDEREFLEAILEAGDLEVCKRMAKVSVACK